MIRKIKDKKKKSYKKNIVYFIGWYLPDRDGKSCTAGSGSESGGESIGHVCDKSRKKSKRNCKDNLKILFYLTLNLPLSDNIPAM